MKLITKKGEFVLRDNEYDFVYFVVDENEIVAELLTNDTKDVAAWISSNAEKTVISHTDEVRYDKGKKTEFKLIDWLTLLRMNSCDFDVVSQGHISAVLFP